MRSAPRPPKVLWLLAVVAAGDLACSSTPSGHRDEVDTSPWRSGTVAVVIAPDEAPGVRWAGEDLARTGALLLGDPEPLPIVPSVDAEEARGRHLLLVGKRAVACPEEVAPVAGRGDHDAVRAQAHALVGVATENGRADTPRVQSLSLCGGGLLGQQYAVYEYLHNAGARFYHPEQSVLPRVEALPDPSPRGGLKVPIIVRPPLALRGFHLHTQHPIELLEPVHADAPDEVERAHRYVDWLVRNRQNVLEWILLNSVPHEVLVRQATRVIDYAHARGVLVYAQSSFSQSQQNAHRLIEPTDRTPALEQIRNSLLALLEAKWDGINLNLGANEFTLTDDRETVAWMDEAVATIADYNEETGRAVRIYASNHVPEGLEAPNYGVNYYDLPQFADPALGVFVHTTMFYGLEGPAPVYGNEDFGRQRRFLVQELPRREIVYFPESAWWLTFDNALPLFLPVYLRTRTDDLAFLAEQTGVDGHVTFTSGLEWGYWLTDYVIAHASLAPTRPLSELLEDLLAPLGQNVAASVAALAETQYEHLVTRDLMPFLTGEDALTEIGYAAGIVFHALAPAPAAVVRMNEAELRALAARLDEVADMCQDFDAAAGELEAAAGTTTGAFEPLPAAQQEGAARPPATIDPQLLLEELRDGAQVTALRCRNARDNYRALVATRAQALGLADAAKLGDPAKLAAAAQLATRDAQQIVTRRETAYRYEAARSYNTAEPPEGLDPAEVPTSATEGTANLTDYPYRVHGRTHGLYFWRRRDRLVAEAIAGIIPPVNLRPQLLVAHTELTADVTRSSLPDGTTITVDWGDGATAELEVAGKTTTATHRYPSPGQLTVSYTARPPGQSQRTMGVPVGVASEIFFLPAKRAQLVEPLNELAGMILTSLMPSVLVGFTGGTAEAPLVSLAFDRSGDAEADDGGVVHLPAGTATGGTTTVSGIELELPVESAGMVLGVLRLHDGQLTLTPTTTTEPGDTLEDARLRARIETQNLVELLVGTGVLSQKGVLDILAGIFNFDASDPPELLDVELALSGERIARAMP